MPTVWNDYLCKEAVNGLPTLPKNRSSVISPVTPEAVDWALLWLPEGGELLTESYVNLIPTMLGVYTLTGCVRVCWMRCEFCEYRTFCRAAKRRRKISGIAAPTCFP